MILISTAGCQNAVDLFTPQTSEKPVAVSEKFQRSGTGILPDKYWLAFKDKQLNKLVEQALAENFTIKIAYDRLKQAEAIYIRSRSELYPQLNALAGSAWSRNISSGQGRKNKFNFGLQLDYEFDIWGRIAKRAEAADYEFLATREDLQAVAISLVAQITQLWSEIIASNAKIKILNEQIKLNKKYCELIEFRYKRGKVPLADLLRQTQLTESKRSLKILALAENKILRQQLAILLGKTPDKNEFGISDQQPTLGGIPSTGLPAELIQRRPDVKAAFLRLKSANANISQAVAERFPRFSFSLDANSTSQNIRNLFDNWLATIAANMLAPILDGDRRKADVERAYQVAQLNLHNYSSTILKALGEVEQALVQDYRQNQYVKSLKIQLTTSQKVINRTTRRYKFGALDYLRILDALQSHQLLQLKLVTAQQQRIQYRINLYRSLAGGWNYKSNVPPPKKTAPF